MGRCLALCLLGIALRAHAAPLSVLDPRLTFDLREVPFSQVLDTLSRGSGVGVASPMARVQWGNMPEEHRRRLDPNVSLSVKDETLRQVLRRLTALGVTVQMVGGQVQVIGVPNARAAEPRPEAKVGAYRVQLQSLTTENVEYRRFGGPMPSRRQTRVELTLDCDTEVASRALIGYGADYQLKLDGAELAAQAPRTQTGWLPLPGVGLTDNLSLIFALPIKPVSTIDSLTGSLRVYPDAKEVALEFGDLDKTGQQQTEGDIDVTLVRFGQTQGGFSPVGQPLPVEAQVTVSYPKTEANEQQGRPMRGLGMGGMAGPEAFRLHDAPIQLQIGPPAAIPPAVAVPGLPGGLGQPQPNVQVQRQGNVTITRNGVTQRFEMDPNGVMRQVEGPPADAPPPPPVGVQIMPANPPVLGLPGGGLVQPAFDSVLVGSGLINGLAPMIVMETAKGRYPLVLRQQSRGGGGAPGAAAPGDRIVVTCTAQGPAPAEPVQRLLIGLVDYGQRTSNVGFAFTAVDLPAADAR
ncbi:MAG: hypothetical protein HZB16_15630 [Armatimonadetes bacterium]|nr:hypothetical protein [Armatimonadota bacterium]